MSIVSVLNQDSLKSDKCVQVSYALDSQVEATSYNYVAVCVASSGEGEYLTYSYAHDSAMGQVQVAIEGYESLMEGQALEVRFYDAHGKSHATCPFTLAGEAVKSFTHSYLEALVYESNIIGTFQLADSDPHRPTSSDYIGVCAQGAAPGDYYCYGYCVGARSGSVPVAASGWESSLVGQNLVLRYYSPSHSTVLESAPFTYPSGALTPAASSKTVAPSLDTWAVTSETKETVVSETVSYSPAPPSPSPSPPTPVAVVAPKPAVPPPQEVSTPTPAPKSSSVTSHPSHPPTRSEPRAESRKASSPSPSPSPSPLPARGGMSIAPPPGRRRFPLVDGRHSAQVPRYADAAPEDIPHVEDGVEKELNQLRSQRPVKATPSASSGTNSKKKKSLLKKFVGGVASALAEPDWLSPRIAQLEASLAQRDQEMFAQPKPRDLDSYLSAQPQPCAETAALQVGMILNAQPLSSYSSKRTTCLYEIRDIDGPMLLLHGMNDAPREDKHDFWVVYDAPVLGALGCFGRVMTSGLTKSFEPHCDFYYDQFLRHVDRAPVPASYYASLRRRPVDKGHSWALYKAHYTRGYWSAANLPLPDPLEGMQEGTFSPVSVTPDYSQLGGPNHKYRQEWYNNVNLTHNGARVTPQQLLQRAQEGAIRWESDTIGASYKNLESKGRKWYPAQDSPYGSLRNPTRVTADTPLPWFLLWADPPALLSGNETQMAWEWHAATLVSWEELSAQVAAQQCSYSVVMPLQYGFYDDNGTPSNQHSIFLQPAWLPTVASCPHLPTSRGRESMEFWVKDIVEVVRVTFKALEDACVAGLSTAQDTSFALPGFRRASFQSRCWPCDVPLPACGWESDLVPKVCQLFPCILTLAQK